MILAPILGFVVAALLANAAGRPGQRAADTSLRILAALIGGASLAFTVAIFAGLALGQG